jgi:type II secretory pathway pseudopilin PulG
MNDALRRRLRAAQKYADAGLTLVETMVACVILVILASAVLAVLLTALRTTDNDKTRVAASSLASRELEIVRQYFNSGSAAVQDVVNPTNDSLTDPDPLPGGTVGQPLVVGGIPFTVVRTVAVQVTGPGNSPCDGGSQVAHPSYSVTATVTWPNMGLTSPVVNQTVLTPPKGVLDDSTTGYVGVKVIDAAAKATSGVGVTVTGPAGTYTATTDSSGCAVVPLSQPGTYTASLNTASYVSDSGNPTPSLTGIDVETGKLTVKSMYYDKAASLNVTFATSAGYALPQTLPDITLANTGIQPSGTFVTSSTGATTSVGNLWPFTSGYTLWATCAAGDPAAAGGTRAGPIVVNGGASGSETVQFTPVDVWVYDNEGDPVAGTSVTASSQACTAGPDSPITLGTTGADGHLAVSLPYGTWTLSASGTTTNPVSVGTSPVTAEVDLS